MISINCRLKPLPAGEKDLYINDTDPHRVVTVRKYQDGYAIQITNGMNCHEHTTNLLYMLEDTAQRVVQCLAGAMGMAVIEGHAIVMMQEHGINIEEVTP